MATMITEVKGQKKKTISTQVWDVTDSVTAV